MKQAQFLTNGATANWLPTLAMLLPTPTPSVRQTVALGAQAELAGDVALEDRLINLYIEANPSVVYIIAAPLGSGSGFV